MLVHQQLIWAKARGVLTHSRYLWAHEPCFYGWVERAPPTRKPPANEGTVWTIDQQGASMGIHPTQKPLALFERPTTYHTEPGELCYEPFAGSGTQLIAAERLGRRCYAMELEPRFVDVLACAITRHLVQQVRAAIIVDRALPRAAWPRATSG